MVDTSLYQGVVSHFPITILVFPGLAQRMILASSSRGSEG